MMLSFNTMSPWFSNKGNLKMSKANFEYLVLKLWKLFIQNKLWFLPSHQSPLEAVFELLPLAWPLFASFLNYKVDQSYKLLATTSLHEYLQRTSSF
jgi:hypothetical protein